MKKPQHLDRAPRDLAAAFDAALARASAARPAIAAAARDPYRLAALLKKALSAYDAALKEYSRASRARWSKQQADRVDGAYSRVTAALSDLLRLDQRLTLLRVDRVLVESDKVFLDDPKPAQAKAPDDDRAGDACCFTAIRFQNLTGRIRVRAADETDASVTADFDAGDERTLSLRDGKGRVLPGGLGRCVTIEVSVQDGTGRYGPPESWRLCCDDQAVAVGYQLVKVPEAAPGATTTSFRPLQITALSVVTPCPERRAGDGTSSLGTPSSGIRAVPGVRIGRNEIFYGAWAAMRYIPNPGTCRNLCFVQGVKREVKSQRPGGREQVSGGLTRDDAFHLDVPAGQRTPCYPHITSLPDGGKEMRDFPGVVNPSGRFEVDGLTAGFDAGTLLTVTWTFRTWVVCLDGPVRVLGHFDWGVVLRINVGRGPGDTTGGVEMRPPRWTDDPDPSEYRRVAGEAPESRGFLP